MGMTEAKGTLGRREQTRKNCRKRLIYSGLLRGRKKSLLRHGEKSTDCGTPGMNSEDVRDGGNAAGGNNWGKG